MDENYILKPDSPLSNMTDQHPTVQIVDKEVQIENIGVFVNGEMNSSIITFETIRFYDGVDLSDKKIQIFYKTSNGIFTSDACDIYMSENGLKFSWIIPYDLTLTSKVIACICITGESYVWKTKNFKLTVENSINISETTAPSTNWFLTIQTDLQTIKTKIDNLVYDWAKQPEKPVYTYEEVGADKAGSAKEALDESKKYVDNHVQEMNISIEEITKKLSEIDNSKANSVHKHVVSDIEDFPKSLPASDVPNWAKEENKPTYTADEIGALPSDTTIPTSLSDLSDDKNNRTVTDEEKESWNEKSEFSGSYNDLTDVPEIKELTDELKQKYDDASELSKENKQSIEQKLDKSGHKADSWVHTDSDGNIAFGDKPTYSYDEVGAASEDHNHDEKYASKDTEHTHVNMETLNKITEDLLELFSGKVTAYVEDETLIIK